jgi:hypothetical protein
MSVDHLRLVDAMTIAQTRPSSPRYATNGMIRAPGCFLGLADGVNVERYGALQRLTHY